MNGVRNNVRNGVTHATHNGARRNVQNQNQIQSSSTAVWGVSIKACIRRQGSRATARHDAWALRAEFGGGQR